jgi:hypothetical protein
MKGHLSILERQGCLITCQLEIPPGLAMKQEIFNRIVGADLIIFMVSCNLIADHLCYEIVNLSLENFNTQKAYIPVPLRPCFLEGLPLADLKMALDKPISKWSIRDEAYMEVVKSVTSVINSRQAVQ